MGKLRRAWERLRAFFFGPRWIGDVPDGVAELWVYERSKDGKWHLVEQHKAGPDGKPRPVFYRAEGKSDG